LPVNRFRAFIAAGFVTADFLAPLSDARGDVLLSQLVVELSPGVQARADIEVFNNGPDRTFVAIDPREVVDPGTKRESSRTDPDPEMLGLLVSPARMILEPGQHKFLRIAALTTNGRERIYRVTVKPVVGQLSSQGSGLKLLVGYDVLVLVRPPEIRPHVTGVRSGDLLTLRNDGNVSVELVDGRQCRASTKICEALSDGRLYAGAEKVVKVGSERRVEYKLRVGNKSIPLDF
jgi:P pilus assembly chaperone PapD